MRYQRATALATALLMVTIAPALAGAETGEPAERGNRASEVPFEIIGGVPWSPDVRVTRNPAADTLPLVTADREHNAHIVWRRSGMWTQTLDRTGSPLSKEVFITPHVVNGYGPTDRFPIGPSVAIDSRGSIHVTWDDGWTNVYYQKFDAWGNVLTDVIHVGNEDNAASHMPSIAVDPVNDHVHIVHEDYEYQCEDIVYDKLDNNGKVLVNEVAVSADVSAHCEGSTLATDSLGYIHVAFGTSMGAMWRKVDQNGVARGISRNIFPFPVFAIPDMAVTPNGDVHMVWSWDGQVLYSRFDHNGTVMNEVVPISTSDAWVGKASIAAAWDSNTVYVVWTDYRDGNAQVYFVVMPEDLQGTVPENHRLTGNKDWSMNPEVTVDPKDVVHVVWEDYRDGNAEVYYKTMYGIRFQMSPVDVSELANMYFFHPNQTKVFHFYIENQGVLPDGYDVSIALDEWAGDAGWSAHLDEDGFRDVEGDTKVFFNLTMTSPVEATAGDFVNVTLRATSFTSPVINETLAWREFIIVEKAVTVNCGEPTKVIEPGARVRFDLQVTNVGDVPDTYRVVHTLIPDNRGWEVETDVDTVSLDVGEDRSLQVFLQAPEGAKTDVNGTVYIRVQSVTDASVWDGKKLMGVVDPTVRLVMTTSREDRWVDPGGNVIFPITIENLGTVHDNITVYLRSTRVLPSWRAVLSPETLVIGPGETRQLSLNVMAPEDALAGLRQSIKVTAVSDDFATSGSLEISALVNQVHMLDVSIDLNVVSVHAGMVAKHLITVHNAGNGNEIVPLGTTSMPPGWSVAFERGEVEMTDIVLLSKETRTFTTVASTSFDTPAGRHYVGLVLTDGASNEYHIKVGTTVFQGYALDLSTSDYSGRGPPGGMVVYTMTLANEGNGEDHFALVLEGLPSTAWEAGFYDVRGRRVDAVTLGAGEAMPLDLRVQVPRDPVRSTRSLDLTARATSSSSEADEVKLTLRIDRPNVRILSVIHDPQVTRWYETNHIHVNVDNTGTYRADKVVVVFLVDGTEVGRERVGTIAPNGNATVTFSWRPSPERKALTFRASCSVQEFEYDDNEVVCQKGYRQGTVDDDSLVWSIILGLTFLSVCLLVLHVRYTRCIRGK